MNIDEITKNTLKIYEKLSKEIIIHDKSNHTCSLESDFLIDSILSYEKDNEEVNTSTRIEEYRRAFVEINSQNKKSKLFDLSKKTLDLYRKNLNKKKNTSAKFKVITTINYKSNQKKPKSRSIEGCFINFKHQSTSKKFKSRQYLLDKNPIEPNFRDSDDYTYAVITLTAFNGDTALNKALDSLSIYRAFFNIVISKKTQFATYSLSKKYPSNSALRVGQFHSLHNHDFSPAQGGNLWHESDHKKALSAKVNIASIDNLLDKYLSMFRNHCLKDHLKRVLITYIDALDSNNMEFRFIKLWSAFEILLKTDSTNELAKKISSFFSESSLMKERILSSREARNRAVHAGVNGNEEFVLKCFELVNLFDVCFDFYLKNPFNFKNTKEFSDFISVTKNLDEINNKIKYLNLSLKYIME